MNVSIIYLKNPNDNPETWIAKHLHPTDANKSIQ